MVCGGRGKDTVVEGGQRDKMTAARARKKTTAVREEP